MLKILTYTQLSQAFEEGVVDAIALDRSFVATYINNDRSLIDIDIEPQKYGVATQKDSELSQSVAYMANNETDYEPTNAKMLEYKESLDVDNVPIVTRAGEIVVQAQTSPADFTHARFNLLRTTFDSNQPSAAMEIHHAQDDKTYRYYASAIDDDTRVVVEQDPAELTQLIDSTASTAAVLNGVSVGQTGYVFAVSGRDYLVSDHPDAEYVGVDALDAGINAGDLEDGNYC